MTCVLLTGRALHSGEDVEVTLTKRAGPIELVVEGARARLADMEPVCADHASAVVSRAGGVALGTVEHLFAALFAARVTAGLEISVSRVAPSASRPELPLLDGGASAWCDALAALELRPTAAPPPPLLRVSCAGHVTIGESTYTFTPRDGTRVDVEVELAGPVAKGASWEGSGDDFRARIAPARTFALAEHVEALGDRGLALGAARESVVVVTGAGLLTSGRGADPDEPARHKLLDLVGDMYAYACLWRGHVHARRPGHAATHAAIRRARDEGILAWA